MKAMESNNHKFFKKLVSKSSLKRDVYKNTHEVFQEFKLVADQVRFDTDKLITESGNRVRMDFRDKGDFEAELRFAGDMLIFNMHSNVFEFPRAHDVMKTTYVKEDPTRSYSGVINIFNFLTDSFRYNRLNDIGYLVARIFINKDKFFLVEGKHQSGFYFNQFMNHAINQDDIRQIIESAMLYSIDFDLLTPPYDLVKEVSVSEMQENSSLMKTRTGKRLGFKFQADHDKSTQP